MKIEMKILTAIHKCKQPRFVLMAIFTSGVLLTTPPVWARKVQIMAPFDASMLTAEIKSVSVRCALLVDYEHLEKKGEMNFRIRLPNNITTGHPGSDPNKVFVATSRDFPVNARGNASGMARVDFLFEDPLESPLKMYTCRLLAKKSNGSVCEVSDAIPSQFRSDSSQRYPNSCGRAAGSAVGRTNIVSGIPR